MKIYTVFYRSNGKNSMIQVNANSPLAARQYVVNFLHAQIITIE